MAVADIRRRHDQRCAIVLPSARHRLADAAGVDRLPDELIFAVVDEDPAGFFATNMIDSSVWRTPPIRFRPTLPQRMR